MLQSLVVQFKTHKKQFYTDHSVVCAGADLGEGGGGDSFPPC